MRFLRLPDVIERTSISRSAIYVHMKNGDFPKPAKIASRTVVWLDKEIDAWMESKVKERDVG